MRRDSCRPIRRAGHLDSIVDDCATSQRRRVEGALADGVRARRYATGRRRTSASISEIPEKPPTLARMRGSAVPPREDIASGPSRSVFIRHFLWPLVECRTVRWPRRNAEWDDFLTSWCCALEHRSRQWPAPRLPARRLCSSVLALLSPSMTTCLSWRSYL